MSIEPSRLTALLGPSGCGKSTLLNLIAGLLPLEEGNIVIQGQQASDFSDWQRVGYMFQDDRLLPWRTALENVAFALEARPMRRTDRRAAALAALDSVGLADFADAFPNALSGGMRSRVALARSLVNEPQILLLDEPFSKLDPTMRTQMHEELLRAQKQRHMTVVFVTHDIEEAVALADKVVVLQPNPGRIKREVPVDLPRPRDAASREVSEQIRALRALV